MPELDPILVDLADTYANARTMEGLTRPLLELLESVTGLESTYLTIVDETAGTQQALFARNSGQLQIAEGRSIPWADSLCRRAQDEGRLHADDVPTRWGDCVVARELGITSFASAPVHATDGQLYGTLCAASTASIPMPANADRVLEMFARLIGQFVEREALLARLREANTLLSTQALIDALTGLPNRRALQMELTRMLARRAREGTRLLVAFIDLDDFKAINDAHGHDTGDALLVAVGTGLSESLRAGDLVARYGGDEFVVVAPAPAEDTGRHATEFQQLLTARSHVQIPLHDGMRDDGMLDYRGASVGMILTEVGELDTNAVIARADAAMYVVKKAHRAGR